MQRFSQLRNFSIYIVCRYSGTRAVNTNMDRSCLTGAPTVFNWSKSCIARGPRNVFKSCITGSSKAPFSMKTRIESLAKNAMKSFLVDYLKIDFAVARWVGRASLTQRRNEHQAHSGDKYRMGCTTASSILSMAKKCRLTSMALPRASACMVGRGGKSRRKSVSQHTRLNKSIQAPLLSLSPILPCEGRPRYK